MHTPTIATFDLPSKRRTQQSSSKHVTYALEACHLEPFGLYFRASADKNGDALQAYVLPQLSLQVVWFGCHTQQRDYDYYLDIVTVAQTGATSWVVRDLYLDILVYEGKKTILKDTDDYLEALAEGHLTQPEAAHALQVSHDTLNGLAKNGYSLETYLQQHSIKLGWD